MQSPSMRNRSIDAPGLIVIIPAYNEARTLKDVVSGIREILPNTQIIVVNDGSTDETGKIAKSCVTEVIEHPKNLGKGTALANGFKVALEKGAQWIATIDGDGQHEPSYLLDLLKPVISGQVDVVVGSRMGNLNKMPAIRVLSNKITSMFVSWRAGGKRIEDSQCGFRVFKSHVLRNIKTSSSGFQTESEILIRAGMQGYKIVSVPIPTIYNFSNSSSIKHFSDTIKFVFLIIRSLFWRI